MSYSITVKLPPEDTILRDLAVTSLLYIREQGSILDVKVEWARDALTISAPSNASIIDVFKGLYEGAATVADKRSEGMRLGILRNDQQIFERLMNEKPEGLTYLNAIGRFLRTYALSDIDLSSLSQVRTGGGGITLGRGGFAALNFLTCERYEYGLEFWRLNYDLRFRIELDKAWYALILAGFALTASALVLVNNELLLTYLPEDFIHVTHTQSKIFEAIMNAIGGLHVFHEKVSNIIYEERCTSEPFSAFVLLVSLSLAKEAEKCTLYALNSLPLALLRIRRIGNVFTMVDKRRAELFDALRFTANLAKKDPRVVNELRRVSIRTLQLSSGVKPRKDEADLTVYNRFCTLLLQAVQGAYSPYEVVYYGARYQLIKEGLARSIIRAFSK